MPQVSIIIPVYNGEKYLHECIDSILAQTFTNIELLLLDDGSQDNSGRICDEYAARDKRVRVIHKSNEGINATRKRGVTESHSEWIMFCDNDDSLPLDAVEVLINESGGTDLVIGFPDKPINHTPLSFEDFRINSITAKRFPPSPWAKLYRRSIFTEHTFDFPREIDGEEDMIMNIRIMFSLERAPHIVFRKVYNFRRNKLSVSHTKKASVAHEIAFDKSRKNSIPPNLYEHYKPFIIHSKINGLVGIALSSPHELKNCSYVTQIKKEIKQYRYAINLQERLLLCTCGTPIVKYIAFAISVKNFIKYRFGFNN